MLSRCCRQSAFRSGFNLRRVAGSTASTAVPNAFVPLRVILKTLLQRPVILKKTKVQDDSDISLSKCFAGHISRTHYFREQIPGFDCQTISKTFFDLEIPVSMHFAESSHYEHLYHPIVQIIPL